MSVGAQMVIVLKAFVEHCVSLVLGHPFEFSWLDVSQTNVFHCSSPPGGSQQHSLAFILYLPPDDRGALSDVNQAIFVPVTSRRSTTARHNMHAAPFARLGLATVRYLSPPLDDNPQHCQV